MLILQSRISIKLSLCEIHEIGVRACNFQIHPEIFSGFSSFLPLMQIVLLNTRIILEISLR